MEDEIREKEEFLNQIYEEIKKQANTNKALVQRIYEVQCELFEQLQNNRIKKIGPEVSFCIPEIPNLPTEYQDLVKEKTDLITSLNSEREISMESSKLLQEEIKDIYSAAMEIQTQQIETRQELVEVNSEHQYQISFLKHLNSQSSMADMTLSSHQNLHKIIEKKLSDIILQQQQINDGGKQVELENSIQSMKNEIAALTAKMEDETDQMMSLQDLMDQDEGNFNQAYAKLKAKYGYEKIKAQQSSELNDILKTIEANKQQLVKKDDELDRMKRRYTIIFPLVTKFNDRLPESVDDSKTIDDLLAELARKKDEISSYLNRQKDIAQYQSEQNAAMYKKTLNRHHEFKTMVTHMHGTVQNLKKKISEAKLHSSSVEETCVLQIDKLQKKLKTPKSSRKRTVLTPRDVTPTKRIGTPKQYSTKKTLINSTQK